MRALQLKDFVEVKKRLPRPTEEQDIFRRSDAAHPHRPEPLPCVFGVSASQQRSMLPPPVPLVTHPPPRAPLTFDWDECYPSLFSCYESPYRYVRPLVPPELPLLVSGGSAERVMRSQQVPSFFHTILPHVASFLDLISLARLSSCSRLTLVILSTFSTVWQLRCEQMLRTAAPRSTQENFMSSEYSAIIAKARIVTCHAAYYSENMNLAAVTNQGDPIVWFLRLKRCQRALEAMLASATDSRLAADLRELYKLNFALQA